MFNVILHVGVGALLESQVDLAGGVISAQQREQVNESVEFRLGVALDHRLEEAKERFDGVGADRQRMGSQR